MIVHTPPVDKVADAVVKVVQIVIVVGHGGWGTSGTIQIHQPLAAVVVAKDNLHAAVHRPDGKREIVRYLRGHRSQVNDFGQSLLRAASRQAQNDSKHARPIKANTPRILIHDVSSSAWLRWIEHKRYLPQSV